MTTPIQSSRIKCVAFVALLFSACSATAQTTGQSISNIPQQVNQSAQTKAVTKSNTVTNNAMNKLDSASNKAFKGFTGLFKKKNKPVAAKDSTNLHKTDSLTAPPKTSFVPQLPSLKNETVPHFRRRAPDNC